MTDPRGPQDRLPMNDVEAINTFSIEMFRKLRANKHKAHWNTVTNEWLFNRLQSEVDELFDAMDDGDASQVIAECADVANFAMMIADNLRAYRSDQ